MKPPVLHALSASIWAVALLATSWAHAQTAVAKTDSTGTLDSPPLSGDAAVEFATLGPALELTMGKSRLLRMSSDITRISLGNPSVADVTLISASELYLLGKSYGSTNLIVWRKGSAPTAIDIHVNLDHQRMDAKLRELLPQEKGIQVRPAANSVILTGTVSSAVKAKAAEEIVTAFVRDVNRSLVLPVVAGDNRVEPGTRLAVGSGSVGGSTSQASAATVVNLLNIAEAQQVMLEVTVAEVSKTLMDKIGINLLFTRSNGSWTYGIGAALGGGGRGLISAIKNSSKRLEVDAEKSDGLVKILAEPNLVSISGQEASFLAGGKVFIPVARSNDNGGSTITLEEKEFGVGVKFTPTVLEGGRIHLQVSPEVSELSPTGTPFSTVNGQTAILPSFTTRRAQTSVQLLDGQSLAIAGLIKNNVRQAMDAVPGLGDVPVLGALFRSNEFQGDRSELMFVITPRLIKPLEPGFILPTDGYTPPERQDIYLGNQMEGAGRSDEAVDLPEPSEPKPLPDAADTQE